MPDKEPTTTKSAKKGFLSQMFTKKKDKGMDDVSAATPLSAKPGK
jgi:hypothetical protein